MGSIMGPFRKIAPQKWAFVARVVAKGASDHRVEQTLAPWAWRSEADLGGHSSAPLGPRSQGMPQNQQIETSSDVSHRNRLDLLTAHLAPASMNKSASYREDTRRGYTHSRMVVALDPAHANTHDSGDRAKTSQMPKPVLHIDMAVAGCTAASRRKAFMM